LARSSGTKARVGPGRYTRSQTELLVLAERGMLPLLQNDQPRSTGSGAGPIRRLQVFERLSPGPRIELSARRAAKGWI
jgi:hypothetical protein